MIQKEPPSENLSAEDKGYILVIDDDPLLVKTLKKLLEKSGYFVDTAHSGAEGIRKAKTGFFHLVLCDIRMPELDGLMTLRRIQDFQLKAGIGKSGFIVMTAYDSDEHREGACRLGVTDFVTKPFDLGDFLSVIERGMVPLVKQIPADKVTLLNQKLARVIQNLQGD